jgi:hypothetical protein
MTTMFDRSMSKTIHPYLQPGEELLAAVLAQASGASTQLMAHVLSPTGIALRADRATHDAHTRATAAAGSAGMKLDRKMVLAVTSQRLLVFKAAGAFTVKAKELLGEVPIDAVEDIAVETRGMVKPVTVHVAGATIGVETARGQPAEALVEAHARATAALRLTGSPG